MAPKIPDFNEGWGEMERAFAKVKMILEGSTKTKFSGEEYMNLHTTIYNMCTQKPPFDFSMRLYDKYKEAMDEYNSSVVLPSVIGKHDVFLLRELVQRWLNHKVLVRWLSHFLHHLDRFLPARGLPTLKVVGLTSFRDTVYMEARFDVIEAMLALIRQERRNEQVDRLLLKNIVDIFVEIDRGKMECYKNDFEMLMLNSTKDYYRLNSAIWIQAMSRSDYMQNAEYCLRREKNRLSQYLHSSTEQKLIEIVQKELLVNHVNHLLDIEHCCALLRDDEMNSLSRIVRLYEKIPGVLDKVMIHVVDEFKQIITDEGTILVAFAEEDATNQKTTAGGSGFQDQNQDQGLVKKFIDLHDKHMADIHNCFMNRLPFFKALREAFEVFCNKTVAGSSTAELLALFCDYILKKGRSEKLSDEEVEENLEKALQLLSYTSDKDHFAEFFSWKLHQRLLFNKGARKHENYIVKRLKQEYGNLFTTKIEKMINDMTLSKDNQMKFQGHLVENSHVNHGIDLTVTLLSTGYWPTFKHFDLTLPPEMKKCVDVFEGFYKTETEHKKKLKWVYSLGTCNVTGTFENQTIQLIVSTHQAAALLLFNAADKLSYSEISSQLKLPEEDLDKLLHSLSSGKYQILVKKPSSQKISSNDCFEFNSKYTYTSKNDTIKLILPPVYERKTVVENVDKDRKNAVDLAIVRIMKSRKVLSLQQLFAECDEQLGRIFKPDIKLIKKRIENLIEREYLERDKDDSNTFRYLPEAMD